MEGVARQYRGGCKLEQQGRGGGIVGQKVEETAAGKVLEACMVPACVYMGW